MTLIGLGRRGRRLKEVFTTSTENGYKEISSQYPINPNLTIPLFYSFINVINSEIKEIQDFASSENIDTFNWIDFLAKKVIFFVASYHLLEELYYSINEDSTRREIDKWIRKVYEI